MLPACPPRSRSRSQPAFACCRTTAPRQAPPRSPVERGLPHCRTIRFRPSLTGNHTNPASHTSLRNPQNPRPVCCDIACFEPRFASWREISQHTTRARGQDYTGFTACMGVYGCEYCAAISSISALNPGPHPTKRSTHLDTCPRPTALQK